jgi:3-dehydroquinate dehydratase-2
MTKIFVLNGANLNMLGIREPEVYGNVTLDEIERLTAHHAAALGVETEFRQSNIEGDIINWIHEAYWKADGVVLNPGGFTRQSVAIHDAIKAISKPVVELHLSNTHKREHYKPGSYITYAADATILGFGKFGYVLALQGVLDIIATRQAKSVGQA